MKVHRRHVIYVPGYDPRGVAHYYRLFRSQLQRYRDLHGLRVTVSRPGAEPDGVSTRWTVRTDGPDWQVETIYELLRWDDVVRADALRPTRSKILLAVLVLLRFIGDGTMWRLARAHWRFAAFFFYPYVLLLGMVLAAGLVAWLGYWLMMLLVPMAGLAGLVGGAIAAAGFVAVLRATEATTYLLYLLDDAVSTDQFARGRRPDWQARLALFAEQVVRVAQDGSVDEIVVVGHSSGSFMAVDVLAQALARDPALGRHGPVVTLMTLGANLPLLGFNRAGRWFVDRLARVMAEPDLAWLDVQSRKDVMSFWGFELACGHGLAVAGSNLTTVSVRFRDVLLPQNYSGFRWRFFRVHFQYLMANERAAAYDYFMMICGPQWLAESAAALKR